MKTPLPGSTSLHVHSAFSPQWGVRSLEDLCRAAKAMGMTRLALTDRNGLYGIPHFLETARAEGLTPIIGAEAMHGGNRAVLLVKDAAGYANLCRLLSELHCDKGFRLTERLPVFRTGLIVFSDDPDVLVPLWHVSLEDLYVELSPGHGMKRALKLARELGLPPTATSRAVFLDREDVELHRVIRAIALNTKLSRLTDNDAAGPTDFLRSPAQLAQYFPHCPEALTNTARIADGCRSDWDCSRTVFPAFENFTDDDAFVELERRARLGALWRYGHIDDRVASRLGKELAIIRDKGFAHYFLVVEEIAKQSLRTCGRGSAAASLVAYCLGITHVDPIRHNLFFERFLNEGRLDPPDIDIDFPWDAQHSAFVSFRDLLRRTDIDPADAALLIKAGCFDVLERQARRPALLWELLAHKNRRAVKGCGSLFEQEAPALPDPPAYDELTMPQQEVDTLGLLLSRHPLTLYRRALARIKPVPAKDMHRWAGRYVTMVGWWVTGKTVRDKHNRPMEFVTFEDTSDIYDATFFPKAYVKFRQKLNRKRPYLLKGKVDLDYGTATLNVEWVADDIL